MAKVPEEIKKEILKVTDPHLRKELAKAAELLSNLRTEIAKLPGGVGGKPKPVLGMGEVALLTNAYQGEEYLDDVLGDAENYTKGGISKTLGYLKKGKLELYSLRKRYGR